MVVLSTDGFAVWEASGVNVKTTVVFSTEVVTLLPA